MLVHQRMGHQQDTSKVSTVLVYICNKTIHRRLDKTKSFKRSNSAFYSIKNDMLWYLVIQSLPFGVWFIFGSAGLIFCICIGIISFLFLETINYIEHYGLRRIKTESGRYERVQTCHSWNSNHSIGRIVLYELTRHSDHHYKSSKKYQILDLL